MRHRPQTIHFDSKQSLAFTERIDGLANGIKLTFLILVVHPLPYVLHIITEQVADNCYGMALACAVCSVYPETLVIVYVVVAHALDNRAQYGIKLLVRDK